MEAGDAVADRMEHAFDLVVAALVVPLLAENVIGMILTIASTFLGLLLGLFLLGMLVPRANAIGAILGVSAGVVALIFVFIFQFVPNWWYGAFACFPTLAVGWLGSYLGEPPTDQQRTGLVGGGEYHARTTT